jgi:hypothetical protein
MCLNHHRIATVATDRDGLGRDLDLSVLISADGRNPYGKSVSEIVSETYIEEDKLGWIQSGIAVAKC